MNNIDLDLNNYNFYELINVFNITESNNIKNNTNKMLKKINIVKTKCNDVVYMFYYKFYVFLY